MIYYWKLLDDLSKSGISWKHYLINYHYFFSLYVFEKMWRVFEQVNIEIILRMKDCCKWLDWKSFPVVKKESEGKQ